MPNGVTVISNYVINQNRVLTRFCIILIFFLMISIVCIAALIPLQKTVVRFVESVSSSGEAIIVRSLQAEDMAYREALIKGSLRKYVIDRESVDGLTDKERYGCVYAMTSKKAASLFRDYIQSEDALFHTGVNRKIRIVNDAVIGDRIIKGDRIVRYDLSYIDTGEHLKSPIKGELVVTLRYSLMPIELTEEELLLNSEKRELCNIAGIEIQDYQIQPRN